MIISFSHTDDALLQLGRALKAGGYDFITSTPLTHARINARSENQIAKNARDVFGWSRLFQSEILAPEIWELMNAAEIVDTHENGFRSTLRLSSLSGNLFWHSAFPTVQSDAVFFGPDTYRFALAVENWIAQSRSTPRRAVDLCSGSGAGAILIADAFEDCEVFSLDINNAALRLARINSALAQTPNVRAQHSDLLQNVDGEFDLIVANPPYLVDESERAYRHGGGDLGAGLSLSIVEAAKTRLTVGGTLLLYTGAAIVGGIDPFRLDAEKLLQGSSLEYSYGEMDADVFGEELERGAYAHCDRIAAVVLTATQKSN